MSQFSGIFRLNGRDLVNGLVMAIISAVLITASNATSISEIDFNTALNVVVITTISYLAKNLATADNGKIGGKL